MSINVTQMSLGGKRVHPLRIEFHGGEARTSPSVLLSESCEEREIRGEEKVEQIGDAAVVVDRTIQFSNLLLRLPIPTDASSAGVRGPRR